MTHLKNVKSKDSKLDSFRMQCKIGFKKLIDAFEDEEGKAFFKSSPSTGPALLIPDSLSSAPMTFDNCVTPEK